jgi:hypothetical protein
MGDDGTAKAADKGPSERFPCSSRIFGLVTLLGLALVFVLVVLDGTSVERLTVLAAIVLIGLGTWLTMVRPSLHVYDDHVLIRNALTDTMVPWHLVESIEVRQVLVIRTEDRVVHGLAIGRTVRQQRRLDRGPTGSLGSPIQMASTFGGDSAARVDYADGVAQRLDHLASENRRRSEGLQLDKRWRSIETVALVGVAVAFVVLLVVAVAG